MLGARSSGRTGTTSGRRGATSGRSGVTLRSSTLIFSTLMSFYTLRSARSA